MNRFQESNNACKTLEEPSKSRGIFRTQASIYDGAFYHLLFSQYKFHHRYWTGLYIGLWHFENEAKLEQIIAVVYNAQRFLLSIVIPSSKTLPLASTFVEFIFNMCLWWDLSPKIMNWNFPGLAFNEFNLNLFNILFVSKIRFSLISVNLSPHEYKV